MNHGMNHGDCTHRCPEGRPCTCKGTVHVLHVCDDANCECHSQERYRLAGGQAGQLPTPVSLSGAAACGWSWTEARRAEWDGSKWIYTWARLWPAVWPASPVLGREAIVAKGGRRKPPLFASRLTYVDRNRMLLKVIQS